MPSSSHAPVFSHVVSCMERGGLVTIINHGEGEARIPELGLALGPQEHAYVRQDEAA